MSIAEGVYRIAGIVAPINRRLSQFRLNFIPSNLLLMGLLAVTTLASFNSIVAVLKSRRPPERQPVRELIFTRQYPGRYVAVEGRLLSDARMDLGRDVPSGNSELTNSSYAPLADPASRNAVLVEFAPDHSFDSASDDVVVQGMLRPIVPAVSRRLSDNNYVHAGMSIQRGFMLVEGRRPGSLANPLWALGISAILLAAMVWAALTRNVIFMSDDDAAAAPGSLQTASPEPLLVSGRFVLDAKTSRFFTNMPAAIGRSPAGDTTLVSHIETSRTSFGVKRTEYSGLWALAIRPGSMTARQSGYVFWGMRKLRAIRFTYVSAHTGKSEHVVVASSGGDPAFVLQG